MNATSPSITRKLTWMNMLVSGVALMLAGVVLAAYDALAFRERMVRNLSTQADIVGTNSVSALLFNDPEAAEQTLGALKTAPEIVSAHIYGLDGRTFASYWRDGIGAVPPPPVVPVNRTELARVRMASVSLAYPILTDGQRVGVVFLDANLLDALYDRLVRYAAVVLAVMIVASGAALLVARVAQRAIAGPLVEMANLARRVSQEKDYGVRAEAGGVAELERLTHAFNDMLSQIQQRDESLREAQSQLESRVRERTAELNAINQELEAFSYSVSHDLRAPLRHVTGFANLLEQHADASLDAQSRRYLKTIIEAAGRMGTLIDDLLAFSRMGRANLSKRRVNLWELVHQAQSEVTAALNGRRVTWEIHPMPIVDADPALLRSALVNLLSNAVKYTATRDEARIEVGASLPADGEVVLFVRDNGVGFDMAYAHKLFGVFQRLHRSEDFSGTGIGLANVRRIVQRHGGRVWAEGEVDRGATFYLSLPVEARVSEGARG